MAFLGDFTEIICEETDDELVTLCVRTTYPP